MAFGEVFGNLKQKVRSVYNNFFYEGAEAPAPQAPEANMYAQEQPVYQQPAPQQGYETYQQAQQPQAPYVQEYQQSVYQQAQQAAQPFQQPRNRRAQQHAMQQENNVVDFGAYQHQGQQAPYQQGYVPQQPQQNFQ